MDCKCDHSKNGGCVGGCGPQNPCQSTSGMDNVGTQQMVEPLPQITQSGGCCGGNRLQNSTMGVNTAAVQNPLPQLAQQQQQQLQPLPPMQNINPRNTDTRDTNCCATSTAATQEQQQSLEQQEQEDQEHQRLMEMMEKLTNSPVFQKADSPVAEGNSVGCGGGAGGSGCTCKDPNEGVQNGCCVVICFKTLQALTLIVKQQESLLACKSQKKQSSGVRAMSGRCNNNNNVACCRNPAMCN